MALVIGSVSLFANSIDFLEDASVNFLIAIAFGWSARSRAQVGMALSGVLLIPTLGTLWAAGNTDRQLKQRPTIRRRRHPVDVDRPVT